MSYIFSGNVVSELASVTSLITEIMHSLTNRIDEERLMELRLILSELMINGCEHGNENDRRKLVFLELSISPDTIDLCVRDEGRGVDVQSLNGDVLNLSCSGRGLKIVSALCDEVRFQDSSVFCTLYRNDTINQ